MGVLSQKTTTLCVQNPSKNDGCGTIHEVTCSNTLADGNQNVNPVDGCKGELQMKRKALKEIFESINGKLGNFVSIFRFGETPQPVSALLNFLVLSLLFLNCVSFYL